MKRAHVLPIALAACLAVPLAAPAAADPTVGIGLSYAFGGGAGEFGLGLRVFSDDRRDRVAASVGVDYMFGSGRIRPSIGAAYLNKNSYVGIDLGYDFSRGSLDFGIGVGGVGTTRQKAPDTGDSGSDDDIIIIDPDLPPPV